MQTQYVVADPFYDGLAHETYPDHFASGFSRGSSFPYQDYRCLLDRGELTSRLCPTSLVDHTPTLDATTLGFAGNSPPGYAFGPPEDIPAYDPASWDWPNPTSQIVAPAPVYPAEATSYLGINKSSGEGGDHQFSDRYNHPHHPPSAQLPTPAAVALLLNPHGRSDREHSQSGYPDTHFESSPLVTRHVSAALRPFIRREGPIGTVQNQGTSEGLSREKKHACTMCHKRFDRPSTLKKHLLVHTGEKAFVCDTCGRRFGVASNLNRHVKRCILKPVNSSSPSHKSTTSGSPSSLPDSPDTFAMSSPNQAGVPLGKRSRASSVTSVELSPPANIARGQSSTSASGTTKSKPPGQKRRRRAPSPSQWVPETLQSFNLLSEDSYRVTQVPLPPVRRNLPHEERDSWDENVNQNPYHPCGWRGVLPGPGLGNGLGLGGKDVRNLDFGGRGGFMLGRVLVF